MPARTRLQNEAGNFDALFRELSDAWWSHQQMKTANTSLATLADSSAGLFKARMAMASWHRVNRR